MDDYALLPPPKPIKALQLTGIVFFAVSGSAYGIEETVSAGGPLLALLGLLLATTVWSAPLALISCELSVAMPHSGGYIVWVNSAFGPLASLLNGVANFLCNIFDCALYPLLLTDYLQRALLPILPPEPHGGGPGSWWRLAPDILGTALRLLLVLLAAAANVSGANVVGIAAGLLMLAVTLPFAWLTVAAYSAPNASVWAPLTPSLQNWPTSYAQGYFLCNLILWNTCGYDSAGMVAAEVVDGRKTFPRALAAALGLTTLLYLLPLAACTAADRRWAMWGEGQFEMLGIEFGGPVLGGALLCASIVSMVGVMCTLMMTSSRAIAAMAVLRMLPAPLARLHPITGAPHLSVVLNASLIAVATCTLRFEALLELSMFFYSINAIMQCASLHRLRRTHPHRCGRATPCPSASSGCPRPSPPRASSSRPGATGSPPDRSSGARCSPMASYISRGSRRGTRPASRPRRAPSRPPRPCASSSPPRSSSPSSGARPLPKRSARVATPGLRVWWRAPRTRGCHGRTRRSRRRWCERLRWSSWPATMTRSRTTTRRSGRVPRSPRRPTRRRTTTRSASSREGTGALWWATLPPPPEAAEVAAEVAARGWWRHACPPRPHLLQCRLLRRRHPHHRWWLQVLNRSFSSRRAKSLLRR